MKTINILGMDYGASNGRGIIGRFDGSMLTIEEIHRFANNPVTIFSNIYWNILGLFNELQNTLAKAKSMSIPLSSIGIDSWALDFGIVDSQGNMLGNPHHYRDVRTDKIAHEVYRHFSEYEIFSRTGMHPLNICTLFQLVSMKSSERSILREGKSLMFIPNLLGYFLTGNASCDATLASASLLYSPFAKNWINEFQDVFELPDILPEINPPGHVIGTVTNRAAEQNGTGKIPVILVAQHDTASAVAAVPAENRQDILYISCGTWSVIGTTVPRPIIDRTVLDNRFNNEIGYDNEVMFVKNLTGLWILQECMREWLHEGYEIDYDYLNSYAEKSGSSSYIDVDNADFAQPGDMCGKIARYCAQTAQTPPESREEIYKSIIMGLALKYRDVLKQAETLTGRKFKRIHIIGGGARNKLLCRQTTRFTGLDVVSGPYEATVIGNIVAQLIALGEIKDVSEAAGIVERSFPPQIYRI